MKLQNPLLVDSIDSMEADEVLAILDFCSERLELVRSYKEVYARELQLEIAVNSFENMQTDVRDAK